MSKYLSVSLMVDANALLHTKPVAELVKHKVRFYVEHPHGPTTLEDIDESNDPSIILELKPNRNAPTLKHFELEGEDRWTTSQGAFVWCCDSRFSDLYGNKPVAVYMSQDQELFE